MGEDINGIAIFDTQYSYYYCKKIKFIVSIFTKPRILQASSWFWSAMPDVQSPWWDVWADLTGAEMKECVSAT